MLVDAFTRVVDDPATVVGLDIEQEGDTPDALGLGHFEALRDDAESGPRQGAASSRARTSCVVDDEIEADVA